MLCRGRRGRSLARKLSPQPRRDDATVETIRNSDLTTVALLNDVAYGRKRLDDNYTGRRLRLTTASDQGKYEQAKRRGWCVTLEMVANRSCWSALPSVWGRYCEIVSVPCGLLHIQPHLRTFSLSISTASDEVGIAPNHIEKVRNIVAAHTPKGLPMMAWHQGLSCSMRDYHVALEVMPILMDIVRDAEEVREKGLWIEARRKGFVQITRLH